MNPEQYLTYAKEDTALHSNLLSSVSTPRQVLPSIFDREVSPSVKITNQKSSGRCWIFAGLNMLRRKVMEEKKLPNDFEFSQSYLFFWDKFERMNYYIKLVNQWFEEKRTLDDRHMNYLLKDAFGDGGQWSMFVNLVNKYGLVDQRNYPESTHSSNTKGVNMVLTRMFRTYVSDLYDKREIVVEDFLIKTFEILTRFFGIPPQKFVLEYKKDKEIIKKEMTPQQFRDDFCQIKMDDYVVLLHDPRHSYHQTYSVEYLNNMEGGNSVKYLNLPMERCLELTKKSLDENQPVWFGSDVGQFFHHSDAMLDATHFDYMRYLNINDTMNKRERIDTAESIPGHAMVYVGYHLNTEGEIDYWKIENSWGGNGNYGGHLVASNKWFKDYTFNLVIPKTFLSLEEKEMWEKEPVEEFPLWDPMGTLA
jgi:bleomycin hydrolase